MSEPKVAICVPVLNCLRYTAEFFATLPTGNHEEILLDNASTDTTQTFFAREMASVTYLRNPHPKCVAASWNQLIAHAFNHGADLAFVANNDIVMTPQTLPSLLRWHASGLEVPTVFHAGGASSAVLKVYVGKPVIVKPPDFCGFLVSKATMERVGPFDEAFEIGYCEDIDWALRAKKVGCVSASCLDAPVFHYGSRTIMEGGVDNGPAFIRNAEYFQRKNGMHYEDARRLISL